MKVIGELQGIVNGMGFQEISPVNQRLTRIMDSIDVIKLIIMTEDYFKINISDEEIESIVSLDDLRYVVEKRLGVMGLAKSEPEPVTLDDYEKVRLRRMSYIVTAIIALAIWAFIFFVLPGE